MNYAEILAGGAQGRRNYIHAHISQHDPKVDGIVWEPWTLINWSNLGKQGTDISLIDIASGWTGPIVDTRVGPTDEGKDSLVVRYCPHVIELTTKALPLSTHPFGSTPVVDALPETPTDAEVYRATAYLDNYLRFVEQILLTELMLWETEPDPYRRRAIAEDSLPSSAMAVITAVQAPAIDTAIRYRGGITR